MFDNDATYMITIRLGKLSYFQYKSRTYEKKFCTTCCTSTIFFYFFYDYNERINYFCHLFYRKKWILRFFFVLFCSRTMFQQISLNQNAVLANYFVLVRCSIILCCPRTLFLTIFRTSTLFQSQKFIINQIIFAQEHRFTDLFCHI